jgi:hypothetical protein
MRMVKWLGAGLVWVVAGVVGLLGVLLSVTVLLLPLGIPLLMLARRLYSLGAAMVVPKAVRHPIDTANTKSSGLGQDLKKKTGKALSDAKPSGSRRWYGRKRKSKASRLLTWVLS